MAPTNTSFATAVTIAAFPCDITQTDINDGGVNFTVFYRFVAPLSARVIGAWGFSGNIGSGYRPTIFPYTGPAGAPVAVLGIAAQNKPIQFPVNPGIEYFLEFRKNLDNAGPNQVRVRCEVAPLGNPAPGDILVNDDTPGFPMWIGTPTTNNETRNFVKDMAAAEAGDIVPTGRLLLEEASDNSVRLYETVNFTQLFNSGTLTGTLRIKSNADRNLFYVGRYTGGQAFYRTITPAGVMSGEVTLTGEDQIDGLCANPSNLILYMAEFGSAGAIRRWDIPGVTFLSNLAAGIANYQIPDIQVLADGTILALYHNLVSQDVNIKRYSAAGAVLNTYSLGVQTGTTKPRMAWAFDSPTSFWAWTHTNTGTSIFTNIRVSDGTVLTTRNQQEYESGVYNNPETATPVTRFGNSFSCPFMILHIPAPPAIFVNVVGKKTDTNGLIDVKIPDPTFKTALLP